MTGLGRQAHSYSLDLRYTQGESHTRHQVSNTGCQPFVTPRKYNHAASSIKPFVDSNDC